MATTLPRLRARLEITNAQGFFDSQSPNPTRGDGLDEPRIVFKVKRTLDPTPNTAEIKIYNLSQATIDRITGTVVKRLEYTVEDRARLAELGYTAEQISTLTAAPIETVYDNFGIASVRLSWGYVGAGSSSRFPPLSIGFVGGSSNMTVVDDGLSRVLEIKAEDGGQLLAAGRLVEYFKYGTNLIDVLVKLIGACGLTVDKDRLETAIGTALTRRGIPVGKLQILSGYNASTAPAAEQIRTVMTGLDLRWSVQDGEFLLLDTDTVLAGFDPLVLSAVDNTLFGNPESLDGGLRVRTWANAEARPGREVSVLATGITAQYRIDRVDHSGDTYGGGESDITLDEIQTIPGVF